MIKTDPPLALNSINNVAAHENSTQSSLKNKMADNTQSDPGIDMRKSYSPSKKDCARQKVRSSHNALLLVLIFCVQLPQPGLSGALSGKTVACTKEEQEVDVPLVETYPCFKCYCKHGQVECVKPQCPSLNGCHAVLFSRPEGHCCDVCKGCTVKGVQMPHGATWPDENNPCLVRTCNAGVVTITEEHCRPPCKHPVRIPGQCCPSCSGCYFNGMNYMSGEIFTLRDEPDVECKCMVGSVTCSSRACPVLNCPAWSRHKLPGHRCSSCKGQRTIFDTPGSCYLAQNVYGQGDTHTPDKCTACECQQGTMVCQRQLCPRLDCPQSDQELEPGACCPVCPNQGACLADGRRIKHGETWEGDNCKTCTCHNGTLQCSQPECPTLSCPKGYVQAEKEGSCCHECVKEYATCSVRGESSDLIKTFGGLGYQTKGYCLHDLVKDCAHQEFSIKVKYEKSTNSSLAAVQHSQNPKSLKGTTTFQLHLVSIRFASTSVKIFRNGRLRVNKPRKPRSNRATGGQRKRLQEKSGTRNGEPVADAVFSKQMSTTIGGGRITVRLESLGVILIWDVARGDLKVKVKVQRYLGQGRLCGLCGSVESNQQEQGSHAQVTRNKRFEPVLPSHMAWVWRRGRSCRKRSRAAREELRQQATSRGSGLDQEITSFLNSAKSVKKGGIYATVGSPEGRLYREDKIIIKPLGDEESEKDAV